MEFKSPNEKQSDLDLFDVRRSKIIAYFHRKDKVILIGEISTLLKLSLTASETLLNLLCEEPIPQIRKILKEEQVKFEVEFGYVLIGRASPRLANF